MHSYNASRSAHPGHGLLGIKILVGLVLWGPVLFGVFS